MGTITRKHPQATSGISDECQEKRTWREKRRGQELSFFSTRSRSLPSHFFNRSHWLRAHTRLEKGWNVFQEKELSVNAYNQPWFKTPQATSSLYKFMDSTVSALKFAKQHIQQPNVHVYCIMLEWSGKPPERKHKEWIGDEWQKETNTKHQKSRKWDALKKIDIIKNFM